MRPIVTVFCAFTRPWAVDMWLGDLERQDYPRDRVNLAFIVEGEEYELRHTLKLFARRYGFRDFRVIINPDHFINEVRISARRLRIVDIKEQSKSLIEDMACEYVIGMEDDTVFADPQTFTKLVEPLIDNDHIGFVQGVQCGRWGVKMIGAWVADSAYTPTTIQTMLPPQSSNKRYQDITAGGFYGYATRRHLYLEHDYNWNDQQPWGPDVNFGMWLKRIGFSCIIDWHLIFGHHDYGKVLMPDHDLAKVIYTQNDETKKWERRDEQKTA